MMKEVVDIMLLEDNKDTAIQDAGCARSTGGRNGWKNTLQISVRKIG